MEACEWYFGPDSAAAEEARGHPRYCACAHCCEALKPLLLDSWHEPPEGQELEALLQRVVAHHGLAHKPTHCLIGVWRHVDHNSTCQRCGGWIAERLEQGVRTIRCGNRLCCKFELCSCAGCRDFLQQYPRSPHALWPGEVVNTYARAEFCRERREATAAALAALAVQQPPPVAPAHHPEADQPALHA